MLLRLASKIGASLDHPAAPDHAPHLPTHAVFILSTLGEVGALEYTAERQRCVIQQQAPSASEEQLYLRSNATLTEIEKLGDAVARSVQSGVCGEAFREDASLLWNLFLAFVQLEMSPPCRLLEALRPIVRGAGFEEEALAVIADVYRAGGSEL